jgi:predicted  nucleic acid-binding Zn-ribbon protein
MASASLGRTNCPECGFDAAHVKRKEEEGKKAYRHCPNCGAQYFPRSSDQEKTLLEKVRPSKLDSPSVDVDTAVNLARPLPQQNPEKTTEPPKRRGLFRS